MITDESYKIQQPPGLKTYAALQNVVSVKYTDTTLKQVVKPKGILVISSYPPRECGIATYSQDLVKALEKTFHQSFTFRICSLESAQEKHQYPAEVTCTLNCDDPAAYLQLAKDINADEEVDMVIIQHEFGLFDKAGDHFMQF